MEMRRGRTGLSATIDCKLHPFKSLLAPSWPISVACCHQAGRLDLRRASSHQMRWMAGGLVTNAVCRGGHGVKRCHFTGFLCLKLLVWNDCAQLETEQHTLLRVVRLMGGALPDLGAFSLPAMPMYPNHFPPVRRSTCHMAGGKGNVTERMAIARVLP